MTELKTIQDAEAALAKYIPAAKQLTGKDITLVRMRPLMQALGNPHAGLKIIHIAGTSGKTSTAYYIAGLLGDGQKVGLTVSPHIDSITERLQINGQPVSEAEFCRALREFLGLIAEVDPEPTYFELLIAFAYWYFAKSKVDYAVVETGLGGLHDSTNIATNTDKICVITDIGLDHMQVLGTTLAEIAAQKAGIIHKGNHGVMYRQEPEITDVVQAAAQKQNAHLDLLDQDELAKQYTEPGLDELPLYQQRNWLLARAACQIVCQRDGWSLSTVADSLKVQVPGRMDKRQAGDKTVVMDGAHNQQKMEAFIGSFQHDYPGRQVPVLLAMKRGKEYQAVLPLLKPICGELILTTFDIIQDLPNKSIEPAILRAEAVKLGFTNISIQADPIKAYDQLLVAEGDLAVVTGSFYLVSCVRKN